jgi:hypothetical protein
MYENNTTTSKEKDTHRKIEFSSGQPFCKKLIMEQKWVKRIIEPMNREILVKK